MKPRGAKSPVKTEITRNEYLQLLGLKTLAVMHNQKIDDIRAAMLELTGEADAWGHTADTVANDEQTVDELLSRLGVEVLK